jgi:hypothetical protein
MTCLALGVSACVNTANVPSGLAQAIPSDARAVRLYSNQPAADYYRVIYQSVAARGFAIAQENQQMGTFSTQPRDIGQETTLKVTVFVQDTSGGSVATLRGQWGVTAAMAAGLSAGFGANPAGGTADEAHWKGSGRPKTAFGELAVIADAISHTRIEYLTR